MTTIESEWPKDLQDENGRLDTQKFAEQLRKKFDGTTLKDQVIDFDSSGYGPSAMLRYWKHADQLSLENRKLRMHINGIRPLTEEEMKRVKFFIYADKKLMGMDVSNDA